MRILISLLLLIIVSGNCAQRIQRQRNRQSGSRNTADRSKPTRICSIPRLKNGFVTPLFKGKMMRFDCNKGYSRLGERYSECTNGRWSLYSFPICIKSGCPAMSTVDNGKITYMNGKASAMLFCEPNFEIVGSNFAHCNGTNWDRAIGTCIETDNQPETSCDFERETICGWMHDTNNDLDFERRSGYNNKTISILTGPSVDHTIGVPFQGHYMVINTNSEVYTKKARLISPLYRMNAKKLCFQLFYHMYGISVGTLKVYAKPESMELQDVLMEDMETEAKNKYVIFEIKDSQGNLWHKGGGMLKNYNESFQIIIEAISGQTRLSDIAIDDVSILTDEDCDDINGGDDNDSDVKDSDTKEDIDDNNDGIFSIDSCVNRCFEETNNSTVHLNGNKTLSCSCSRDCNPKVTCCPDFLDVCIKDDSSLVETTPEATVNAILTTIAVIPSTTSTTSRPTIPTTAMKPTRTTQNLTTSSSTTTTTLPTTLSTTMSKTTLARTLPTTSTTIRTTKKSTTTIPTTTSKLLTTTTSTAPSTIPVKVTTVSTQKPINEPGNDRTKDSDIEEVSEIEDEHDIMPDEDDYSDFSYGKIRNEKYQMHTKKEPEKSSFMISTIVIVVSSALFIFIAIIIVYGQYKKSTNPLNYKEKSENGTARADEEFSEIRYLTSDEELDFTLASIDGVTDL